MKEGEIQYKFRIDIRLKRKQESAVEAVVQPQDKEIEV